MADSPSGDNQFIEKTDYQVRNSSISKRTGLRLYIYTMHVEAIANLIESNFEVHMAAIPEYAGSKSKRELEATGLRDVLIT